MHTTALKTTLAAACLGLATTAVAKEYPEFGGRCAMGIASGKAFETDCSITWKGSDGNTYCFGNEKARRTFLERKDVNLTKAFANYRAAVK